ncbi:MAG: hypothetical protein AABO41_12035 [Acidobacteriota bacterium]
MESPYRKAWRLQDVIAAIQVMGSSAWVNKRIRDWEESLGIPRSAETWEAVLRDHPEFFTVRIAPWISGGNVRFSPLVTKLKNAHDPVSWYLKEQLTLGTQQLLDNSDPTAVSDELKGALHRELNSLLRQREFSEEQSFKDRAHPINIDETVDKSSLPLGDARMIRNRLLLEAEYPSEILKEDFQPRAALTWRLSYDKNYQADEWRQLTSEEWRKLTFKERDRLSRRPLEAEQVRALVATALELHTHALAEQQEIRELRNEVRANQQEARVSRAQQLEEVHNLLGEVRADREQAREDNKEARADRQARLWWIPLAAAILSFLGAILGAALKGK